MDSKTSEVRVGLLERHVEMKRVSAKMESLSSMREFNVLDFAVLRLVEHQVSAEFVVSNFVVELVQEAVLNRSLSRVKLVLALWEIFNPFFVVVSSEFDVASEETNFSFLLEFNLAIGAFPEGLNAEMHVVESSVERDFCSVRADSGNFDVLRLSH
jgi:hypothetical protein